MMKRHPRIPKVRFSKVILLCVFLAWSASMLFTQRSWMDPNPRQVTSNAVVSLHHQELQNASPKSIRGRDVTRSHYSDYRNVPRELRVGSNSTDFPVLPLSPLFTCRDPATKPSAPGRKRKLVFVHIFKTAGSSLRVFFREYSSLCHAGWQVVIRCTGVDANSVKEQDSKWWHIENQAPCVQKKGILRDGRPMEEETSFDAQHLEQNVDILGGHMELGATDYSWPNHDDLTYISFFRNATTKFVSARMYKKKRTLQEHVDSIREEVERKFRKDIYYEGYYKYLVTPFQKEDIERRNLNLTMDEKVSLMQQNLIDYKVVCGITERMPASLEILHHLIDSDDRARDLFEAAGMPDKEGNQVTKERVRNHAEIPTSAVVSELAKDPIFYAKLLEHVKYEQKVTDFALQIHLKQHQSIQNAITK